MQPHEQKNCNALCIMIQIRTSIPTSNFFLIFSYSSLPVRSDPLCYPHTSISLGSLSPVQHWSCSCLRPLLIFTTAAFPVLKPGCFCFGFCHFLDYPPASTALLLYLIPVWLRTTLLDCIQVSLPFFSVVEGLVFVFYSETQHLIVTSWLQFTFFSEELNLVQVHTGGCHQWFFHW